MRGGLNPGVRAMLKPAFLKAPEPTSRYCLRYESGLPELFREAAFLLPKGGTPERNREERRLCPKGRVNREEQGEAVPRKASLTPAP